MASVDRNQQSLWIETVLLSWFLPIWFVGKYFCCKYRGRGEQERTGAPSSAVGRDIPLHIFSHIHGQPSSLSFLSFNPFSGYTAGDMFALERWLWLCNYKILPGKKSWGCCSNKVTANTPCPTLFLVIPANSWRLPWELHVCAQLLTVSIWLGTLMSKATASSQYSTRLSSLTLFIPETLGKFCSQNITGRFIMGVL